MSEHAETQKAFHELAMDLAAELAAATADLDLTPKLEGFTLLDDEAAIPAPQGFGRGDVTEARKALAEARKGSDVQATLDAHHAWLDLAEEMPAAIQRAQDVTYHLVLTAALVALIAGLALGFGSAALLFGLVGR